jgi:hypothetical protein
VDRISRDEQLLADLRVADLAGDLELHLALQHGHQLVRRMREVLPALARRVHPQVAAETPRSPLRSDLLTVHFMHRASSLVDVPVGGLDVPAAVGLLVVNEYLRLLVASLVQQRNLGCLFDQVRRRRLAEHVQWVQAPPNGRTVNPRRPGRV